MKIFGVALVAIVLSGLGLRGVAEAEKTASAKPSKPEPSLGGKTVPAQGHHSKFGPCTKGRVKEVKVWIGKKVEKGEVLVLMEEDRSAINAATAALECAKADLQIHHDDVEEAKHKLECTRKLATTLVAGKSVVAETEIKEYELKVHHAQAEVLAAEARVREKQVVLDNANADLQRCSVCAETKGTIVSLNADPGQFGNACLGEILDSDALDVESTIPQEAVKKIPANNKVTLSFDLRDDQGKVTEKKTVEGLVTFIDVRLDGKRHLPIRIHIAKPDGLLLNEPVTIKL